MEKKLFAVILVMFFVGTTVGYSANSVLAQSKIDELTNQIATLQTQVTNLQTNLNGNLTKITELEADIDSLQAQLEIELLGVYFSPDGECESKVIEWIGRANSSIHILIYSFTLDSVSEALITAYNEGVEIQVVFEKSQISQYSEFQTLKAAGLSVRNDTNSNLMHHKVMIIDEKIVLTGSFNWSMGGQESNNENLIVIKSTYITGIYEEEFQEIWLNSL